jgi:hypothetical protein
MLGFLEKSLGEGHAVRWRKTTRRSSWSRYEIRSDSWPFHVYIGKRTEMRKIGAVGESRSMKEAFELGFEVGRLFIDCTTTLSV